MNTHTHTQADRQSVVLLMRMTVGKRNVQGKAKERGTRRTRAKTSLTATMNDRRACVRLSLSHSRSLCVCACVENAKRGKAAVVRAEQ